MLKVARIESNLSKFSDSNCQNIDQVNLLVEFIGENDSNKNDNCSHNCRNISNQLIFDRMILSHLHMYASSYWKLSKIWVMFELKNPTLNSISVWVHHQLWHSTNWEKKSVQHFSCLTCLENWSTFSALLFRQLSSYPLKIRLCLT